MADKLSLAALIAANAFEKAKAKRRNIPYTPFAPTKSQLEDWKEVVLAVRAALEGVTKKEGEGNGDAN